MSSGSAELAGVDSAPDLGSGLEASVGSDDSHDISAGTLAVAEILLDADDDVGGVDGVVRGAPLRQTCSPSALAPMSSSDWVTLGSDRCRHSIREAESELSWCRSPWHWSPVEFAGASVGCTGVVVPVGAVSAVGAELAAFAVTVLERTSVREYEVVAAAVTE